MAGTVKSRGDDEAGRVLHLVPVPLQVAAAWSWRLIVIGVVAIALFSVIAQLSAIAVPIAVALLIAAPLERAVTWLAARKVPRAWGAAGVLVVLVVSVSALLAAASQSVVTGLDELRQQARDGLNTLIDWLSSGPLHLSADQIQSYIDRAGTAISENKAGLVTKALSVTSTVGLLAAGTIFGIFCLFFFLKDGRSLWLVVVEWFPPEARERVDSAGRAGWVTLSTYTRTSVVVALVGASGIGLAAWILGLGLALPIAIVVFLASFIPLFGASVTGVVAVLVALVEGGWVRALIMLGAVLFVHLVVGNVLYPWLFGKAASVHPIAILLTVSAGTIIGGVVGALLAVPIFTFTRAFVDVLRAQDPAVAAKEVTREPTRSASRANPKRAQVR